MINNKGKFQFWEASRQALILCSFLYILALLSWRTMPLGIIYAGGILVLFSMLIVAYTMAIGLTYVSFERDKGVCTFKYFTSYIFARSHKRVIIPEDELAEAIIKTSNNNWKHELLLKQRSRKGMSVYPPINVSFLSEKKRTEILNSLTKIVTRNNA